MQQGPGSKHRGIEFKHPDQYAFLKTINKSNYESASQNASAGGDVEITDLFKVGDAHASYDQFAQKRATYFVQHQTQLDVQTAESVLRQTVSYTARKDFYDCVAGARGLHLWFSDDIDTKQTAILNVKFRGRPGDSTKITIDLNGGKFDKTGAREYRGVLLHDGSETLLVRRDGQHTIKAAVNSGGKGSDAAASVAPAAPGPLAPQPSTTRTVHCLAASGFQYISVHAGDKVRVRAGISAQCGQFGWTADNTKSVYSGPDGLVGGGTYADALLPSELTGVIVGAFSPKLATTTDSAFNLMKASSPFRVGSSFDGQASVDGWLPLLNF